ncbi:hypothetical protein [Pontiella sulfatireligans]|uniref:STAS/SEC14 domain-containing protein n=1 Tax=Pontiella sulfatireligans TaxID=2750658 RepID=A0A6C2ULI9_9BACT|nr:hypothetical protein [Pontiella sulfatireligans]VGO21115.1 hypothetical protein SCARR_03185 [Pontiella sulfatireligans]
MYHIHENPDHLLVEFRRDFDYPMIQTIIHHETTMLEYPATNDIWLIGTHHADIRLGELESMVQEFQCRCPKDATRTKTAVVCDQGLTQAVIELWMAEAQKRVAFEMRMFKTLEEAEGWLGVAVAEVA